MPANLKNFERTDVVVGKSKIKYFPSWTDVASDVDSVQQSTINAFYINNTQTGSFEGYYYWNFYNQNPSTVTDTPAQFSVAFAQSASAHTVNTTGNSLALGDEYDNIYPSYALYRQLVNTTIDNSDATTKLTYIESGSTKTIINAYVVSIARTRIKDYIDPSSWQLNLSGSKLVNLIAEASTVKNQNEFLIVYGTASSYTGTGMPSSSVAHGKAAGKFIANRGLLILDADALFISGAFIQHPTAAMKLDSSNQYTASLLFQSFAAALVGTSNTIQAGIAVSQSSVSSFIARSAEKVQSIHYFCRARNDEFNNSTNPTWVSGSSQVILPAFSDDPRTFITAVGLYDGTAGDTSGRLVAIAKLSKPVPKGSDLESLIKVRLDF